MKKIKCLLILIMLFFITGCSSYDMSMKIEKDKSMRYSVTILSDYYSNDLANNISIYKQKYEQYGYFVEEYNQNNKYGMIISKKFDNIDDISYGKRSDEFDLLYLYNDGYNSEVEKRMFNVDKSIVINRYAANFYVDLSNLGIDLNNATVTYSVELPNGSLSNNANSISEDGKILTWNITSYGKTEIDYVFEINSYDYIYYGVAIIVVLFLFFSIISNLFGKGSNKDNKNAQYNDNIDKKIENLTKNAIQKSANNNVVNKVNVSSKTVNVDPVRVVTPSSANVRVIPQNKTTNEEMKDDITNFKTPIKEKKNNLFGFLNGNKNQEINNNNINNNEEFNRLIDNINNNNITPISSNEMVNNSDEDIPDPFGGNNISVNKVANNINTIDPNTNVNIKNGGGSILDWYDSSLVNTNNINNTNTSDSNSNFNSDNKSIDNGEINIDVPIIRVNNNSVTVNNDKKEE